MIFCTKTSLKKVYELLKLLTKFEIIDLKSLAKYSKQKNGIHKNTE